MTADPSHPIEDTLNSRGESQVYSMWTARNGTFSTSNHSKGYNEKFASGVLSLHCDSDNHL